MALSRPANSLPAEPDQILVLRALGLGDFLTAVPALRGLRAHFSRARITLAANPVLAPLLPLVGCVDDLLPTSGLGALRVTAAPDVAVNLHGRGPESIADLVGTGAATILTHQHPAYPQHPGVAWVKDQHERARWCRLLTSAGVSADPDDLHLQAPALASIAPGAVVIHPGAADPARRWPVEYFGAVARTLRARGHFVVVTGTAGEAGLGEVVARSAGLPASAVLIGQLDLAELASLVAAAALVISADTGVAHLASAYRTPSVVLFGPVSPLHWGPPRGGRHRVLWRADSERADGGLALISPTDVLVAADLALAGTP